LSWTILTSITLGLALAVVAMFVRRREARALAAGLEQRRVAKERGSDRARLQYPHVDLTRCIGCGTCVRACPEDGVLDVIHGQAVVVHGARCVGHGRCAEACPTGALSITLGDLSGRRDIPALEESLEAVGHPRAVPGR
jgi:thioredoxin reductase (NADPH)